MLNPVLKNRSYSIAYFAAWLLILAVDFFIQLFFFDYPISVMLFESFVGAAIFAVIGIGIWYNVYYSDFEKYSTINFYINHISASAASVALWNWLSHSALIIVFPSEQSFSAHFIEDLPWRIATGFLLYLIISTNFYLYIYYNNFKDKQLREAELKSLVKESELSSLKAKINPHFLYNSLNSISALTMISPEKAQEMLINLSDFLRYSISQEKEALTSFAKELDNVNRYLRIEKTRFGDKLNIVNSISEECDTFKLPGLILQPIIENAVKYGVYDNIGKSDIYISAHYLDNMLTVTCKNSYDPDFLSKRGEGLGLRNVIDRIKIFYSREDLVIINKSNNIFEIILRFPQIPNNFNDAV